MAKKKKIRNGANGRKGAFIEAMNAAANAKLDQQTAATTAASASDAQPVVDMHSFPKQPAIETPIRAAAGFLLAAQTQNPKEVKDLLQGLNIVKTVKKMDEGASLLKHQQAQITEAATKMGWTPPDSTQG